MKMLVGAEVLVTRYVEDGDWDGGDITRRRGGGRERGSGEAQDTARLYARRAVCEGQHGTAYH